jgi:AraC-like DNA-binding protein
MIAKRPNAQKQLQLKEPGVHIFQSRQAQFHNMISPVPAIIWVLNGTKRVSSDRDSREVSSDYFVLLPENRSVTIENIPHGNKPYEARVLAFDRETFEGACRRLSLSENQRRRSFQIAAVNKDIAEAFLRARAALSDAPQLPPSIVRNRCEEVILWLAEAGACLPWSQPASFADRARSVIAPNPGHSWISAEVGHELAVSEATLRRKLQAERTSFKKILLDVRMVAGLTYLQTTNWRVSKIAKAVGYTSQTRFSSLFQERFGIHPADFRKNPG